MCTVVACLFSVVMLEFCSLAPSPCSPNDIHQIYCILFVILCVVCCGLSLVVCKLLDAHVVHTIR